MAAWSLSRFVVIGVGIVISEHPWVVLSNPLPVRIGKVAFAAQAVTAVFINRVMA
jgi:hypothetical protein